MSDAQNMLDIQPTEHLEEIDLTSLEEIIECSQGNEQETHTIEPPAAETQGAEARRVDGESKGHAQEARLGALHPPVEAPQMNDAVQNHNESFAQREAQDEALKSALQSFTQTQQKAVQQQEAEQAKREEEAYAQWLEGLSPEERGMHLVDVITTQKMKEVEERVMAQINAHLHPIQQSMVERRHKEFNAMEEEAIDRYGSELVDDMGRTVLEAVKKQDSLSRMIIEQLQTSTHPIETALRWYRYLKPDHPVIERQAEPKQKEAEEATKPLKPLPSLNRRCSGGAPVVSDDLETIMSGVH